MLGEARTKRQQRRFEIMHDAGCVPCWLESKLQGRKYAPEPADMHHVEQDDHAKTYACCPWHHRGLPKNMLHESRMNQNFGPSMAKEPARYRARYGNEEDLLRFQQTMIEAHCKKWRIRML
jgi:hypothetical protein